MLRLIRHRRTEEAIGEELAITERTVRRCVQDICAKLGVRRRAKAVRVALRLGVLAE